MVQTRAQSAAFKARGDVAVQTNVLGATGSLLNLPVELVQAIAMELTVHDLLACGQVCRYLADVIRRSVQLLYKIELFAAGMVDGGIQDPAFPVGIRLARLKVYQLFWYDLGLPVLGGWDLHEDFKVALTSGWLLMHDGRWRASGSALRLPAVTRGIVGQERIDVDVIDLEHSDLTAAAYYTDIFQDLQVLVLQPRDRPTPDTWSISFRSLRQGKRHPLAASQYISFEREGEVTHANLRGRGDFVALATKGDWRGVGSTVLQVWNWKTGKCVMLESLKHKIVHMHFEFLNERHIAVFPNNGITILRLKSGTPSEDLPPPDTRYLFSMPDFKSHTVMVRPVGFNSHETPLAALFRLPSEVPLLVVRVWDMQRHDCEHLLFVPTSTLFGVIADTEEGLPMPLPDATFPWADWTARGVRVVQWNGRVQIPNAVSIRGWKVVLAYNPSYSSKDKRANPRKLRLELFDFAPGALRVDHLIRDNREKSTATRISEVAQPGTYKPSSYSPFKEAVTTALPYRRVVKTIACEALLSDFLLTTDGFVTYDEDHRLKIYGI